MEYIKATEKDIDAVYELVQDTIKKLWQIIMRIQLAQQNSSE